MKILLKEITIEELANGFTDNAENGVVACGGNLDVRPPYQREFIYKDAQRNAVIDTVFKGYPLNVMYWAELDGGRFEVIDGQQRTISICQYIEGDFSMPIGAMPEARAFHNLQKDEQERIMNYKLMIYQCSGTESERLEWFKTINIAGEKLTAQELRNAVYSGPFVSDAKRHFSKHGCAAYGHGGNYLSGSAIRQDYLETVIAWKNNNDIEGYMSKNQRAADATELWLYFQSVINWVKAIFPTYRKEMKGVEWGFLYNKFKDAQLVAKKIESDVKSLMQDDEVQSKRGIYAYILDGDVRHLNLRTFSDNERREVYERQNGICPMCKKHFKIEEMHADHIKPWSKGGKTKVENCQMLCRDDNLSKSAK